jgi:hypothetical protein
VTKAIARYSGVFKAEFISASAGRGGRQIVACRFTSTSSAMAAKAFSAAVLAQTVTNASQGGARNDTFLREALLSISIVMVVSPVPNRATQVASGLRREPPTIIV